MTSAATNTQTSIPTPMTITRLDSSLWTSATNFNLLAFPGHGQYTTSTNQTDRCWNSDGIRHITRY